jgi:hypothetical protein
MSDFLWALSGFIIFSVVRNYELRTFGAPTKWPYGDFFRSDEMKDVATFHAKTAGLHLGLFMTAEIFQNIFSFFLLDLVYLVSAVIFAFCFIVLIAPFILRFIFDFFMRERD